jgi:hypothetical protein
MAKSLVFCVAAGLIGLALAGPATAGRVMYSYDSVTPITLKMTENGVTFILDKSLMRVKVLSLVETQDIGQADLRPAPESDLGRGGLEAILGRDAQEHDLYEITQKGDGHALVAALCNGANKGWLVFGLIKPDHDLKVRALGRDAVTGKTRLCVTLDYSFHGEWGLPQADLPQPDRTDWFNDTPNNRRY